MPMPVLFAKDATLRDGRGEATTPSPLDGRDDFDFFAGCWTVTHRRLIDRLVGDTRWQEFGGICESRPILGGLANIDDNILELPAGTYRAATLRVFNPGTRLWSISWIDGRAARLDPPVHGRFENGAGTFLGEDALSDSRRILVRFVWSEITRQSARWEQAFSPDGGATWECNWSMRFERAA
jgi:hypothetical protein